MIRATTGCSGVVCCFEYFSILSHLRNKGVYRRIFIPAIIHKGSASVRLSESHVSQSPNGICTDLYRERETNLGQAGSISTARATHLSPSFPSRKSIALRPEFGCAFKQCSVGQIHIGHLSILCDHALGNDKRNYVSAGELTCGSLGSGEHNSACKLSRAVFIVSAGLHWSFRMSRQMAPV